MADEGVQRFGSGSTSIRVTQDLQVLSGLPPLVREGDLFAAMLTLRNTTARTMKLRAALVGTANSGSGAEIVRTPLNFPPQELTLAAGAAQEITWPVDVPADAFSIAWEAAVDETGGAAKDRLKLTQLVSAAVPVRVLQATLTQLDAPFSLPVAAPADALPASGTKRGGLAVALQPKLSGALPGMRRFFETYPFICLEQKTSKAVGLRDEALWNAVSNSPADLPRQGRTGELLPAARRGRRARQRPAHGLHRRCHARGRLRPASGRARRDARRAYRLRRRPHRAQVLVAQAGSSTCASSPPSRPSRATAARRRECSARSTSPPTSGRRRR